MSNQKLVRFKQNELHRLYQLVESKHPIMARKIKGYMGTSPGKLEKIESHRLAMQENAKIHINFTEFTIEEDCIRVDTIHKAPFERVGQ